MAFDQVKYIQDYNKEHYYRPTVYLPLEYKEKLKDAAIRRTDGNVSKLITQAIDEYFEKYESND